MLALENVEELFAEAFEADREAADAVVVVVVGGDRRDGGEEADGGGDQCFGDAGSNDGEAPLSRVERPVKAFMMPQTVPKRPM